MDYICTPLCNITFVHGDTIEVFNITLVNNGVFEGIKQFNVGIAPPDYVSQGNPSDALVLIANMDG